MGVAFFRATFLTGVLSDTERVESNVHRCQQGTDSEIWQSLSRRESSLLHRFCPGYRNLHVMSLPPSEKTSTGFTSLWSEVRTVMDLVLDFSFKRFVTPHLIRVLYALSLLAAVLAAVTWMFSGFSVGLIYGLFTLVTGPVAFVIYVLTARVLMEVILAIFQIAEKVRKD